MIYFDNAATTKPSKEALAKASVINSEKYFNPSALYGAGLDCARELKTVKEKILKYSGAINGEVIFTSCGTESDNTAVFCAVKRGVFVTDKGEHSAIYKSFTALKERGFEVYFTDLNKDGSVNEEKLLDCVKENSADFVSIVHVNNETGAINDINSLAAKIKKINPKAIFHSDGVQAFGKLDFRLSPDIDLYSVSAHKINGLKGVGAIIKKKGLNLSPLVFGGGQENGYRSGTENLFGIKVFEYAADEHYSALKENYEKVKKIKEYFACGLDKNLFEIISGENSSPYILTVSAAGLRGETVMHALEERGIIVGNGSACSSKNRFSRIIKACGYSDRIADGIIRISFSSETSFAEAETAVPIINETVKKLKGILH